jgi:hypothetical protein
MTSTSGGKSQALLHRANLLDRSVNGDIGVKEGDRFGILSRLLSRGQDSSTFWARKHESLHAVTTNTQHLASALLGLIN